MCQVPKLATTVTLLVLVALVWVTPAEAGTRSVRTLTSAGESRSYIVYRPAGAPAHPALVISLGGGGADGAAMEGTTHFDTLADTAGFVAAYPDPDPDPELNDKLLWRIGCCSPFYDGTQDVTLISDLIDTLIATEGVDPKRVYVEGFSVGGGLAHRVACELSSKVAAIASVSGYRVVTCAPDRPVSVLEIHGTGDGQYTNTVQSMASWAQLNGCPSATRTAPALNLILDNWGTCRSGTSTQMVTVQNGAHCYPVPQNCGQFDASRMQWDFLSTKTLAPPGSTGTPAPTATVTATPVPQSSPTATATASHTGTPTPTGVPELPIPTISVPLPDADVSGATLADFLAAVPTAGSTPDASSTSPLAWPFACYVPDLRGVRLAKVRAGMPYFGCRVGRVRRPARHRGRLVVRRQSAAPGTFLALGSAVDLALGRPRRAR